MQYQTCSHIKEDGTYCGSPALQSHKYCRHHPKARGRRLRRARALRDNVPYRLDLPALEDLAAVQVALSEIVQALGTGQLDHRAAGKMLYAIQQTTSVIKFRAKLEAQLAMAQPPAQEPAQKPSLTSVSYQGAASAAPQAAENTSGFSPCDSLGGPDFLGGPHLPASGKCGADANSRAGQSSTDLSRVQAYPGFEQEFGVEPGADVDAETAQSLREAEEEAKLLHADAPPPPPPGVRPGSAQYRVYREEVYQSLNIRINRMKHELRDYHEHKRKESEKLVEAFKKEAMSATPVPKALSNSA